MKKTVMTVIASALLTLGVQAAEANDNRTTLRFHSDASLTKGSQALGAGDYEQASRYLKRALRHNLSASERLAAANNLCIAEQGLGDMQAALKACELAVRTDRHSWQALVNLGNVQISMGDKEGAVKSWRRAVAKSKKADQAHEMLAAIENSPASRLALAN